MRVCFVIKYPPIEGGVSAQSYWLSRAMAERGHEVFVATNANEVEDQYRIHLDETDEEWYEPKFPESGGSVTVRHTQPMSDALMHIPISNPYVTKLASVATQLVRKHRCEAIYAQYLQPYGMAAYLASLWTGVPFMVKHAGSDLGRLMRQRDMTTAFREVLKAAACVWSGMPKETFQAMGVQPERIWSGKAYGIPPVFHPGAEPLDLNALLRRLQADSSRHVQDVLSNTAPIDTSKPTIGIYGKVGEAKGSFDLLAALAQLQREGREFNLVALTQGWALPAFRRAVTDHGLDERTWLLPFIAHWKVAGFIRSCTAVCFLERDFPISFHAPMVHKEVLAAGTCLILSGEIAAKDRTTRPQLVDGRNVLIVPDPKQHAALADRLRLVMEDPAKAQEIGRQGAALFEADAQRTERRPVRLSVKAFEDRLRAVAAEHPAQPADEPVDAPQRHDALGERLPRTRSLLGGRWEALVDLYCATEERSDGAFRDAIGFCRFLEARLGDVVTGADAEALADVVRFERMRNSMYTDGETARPPRETEDGKTFTWGERPRQWQLRFDQVSFGKRGVSPQQVLELRPVRQRGVSVETFGHRVSEADAARADRPLHVLFKKERNFVALEMEISEPLKYLLDRCTGERTVRELVDEVAERYGASEPALQDDVLALMRDLTTKGVIHLSQ